MLPWLPLLELPSWFPISSQVTTTHAKTGHLQMKYGQVTLFIMILHTALWLQLQNLNQTRNVQQTSHSSLVRVSYGVSAVKILKKIYHYTMAMHLYRCPIFKWFAETWLHDRVAPIMVTRWLTLLVTITYNVSWIYTNFNTIPQICHPVNEEFYREK